VFEFIAERIGTNDWDKTNTETAGFQTAMTLYVPFTYTIFRGVGNAGGSSFRIIHQGLLKFVY